MKNTKETIKQAAYDLARVMKRDCTYPEQFNPSVDEIADAATGVLSDEKVIEELDSKALAAVADNIDWTTEELDGSAPSKIYFDAFDLLERYATGGVDFDYVGADYFIEGGITLEDAVKESIYSTMYAWYSDDEHHVVTK